MPKIKDMDLILSYADPLFNLDWVYDHTYPLPRDNIIRQSVSLLVIWTIGGWLAYLSMAVIDYVFWFDKNTFNHPRYLKNQMRLEMNLALSSIPTMAVLTMPWFVGELLGYSKLFDDPFEHGTFYFFLQFPLFLLFTDFGIYLIHRGLHHPSIYKYIHKPHHKWLMPTPFASHAFHPLDGYAQSLPYHIFPFLFPLHKTTYVVLFLFVNVWTISIHDGAYFSKNAVLNGSACHTIHHLYFNYNYGQYTTLWDRLGGSYRAPTQDEYDHKYMKNKESLKTQLSEMSSMVKEIEGSDDRQYLDKVKHA